MSGEGSTPTPSEIEDFRHVVLAYWRAHGRHDHPWRQTRDPYAVLVSEVMLQQTQVSRVLPRYAAWMERFPTADALAAAPLEAVLESWQGLGYNRRAVALKRTAEQVVDRFGGVLPAEEPLLRSLPGIGPATAAGVRAFAFGEPGVYLETNVRTVILHHFFADRDGVTDREVAGIVEATVDLEDPARWYWAMLDYGSHLKRTLPNPSRRSRHHGRQSAFEGSRRQMRARLLRRVLEEPGLDAAGYAGATRDDPLLAVELLGILESEGFVVGDRDGAYRIA